MDDNCIFCKILNGDSPGVLTKITDNWATLVPNNQISKGHILIIPTFHCKSILDLENNKALLELGQVLQTVSKEQLTKFSAVGINILNANNKPAQQTVFHLHFHIVPRYESDNLNLWFREGL
jgi:histidine triad (HIT) family protein